MSNEEGKPPVEEGQEQRPKQSSLEEVPKEASLEDIPKDKKQIGLSEIVKEKQQGWSDKDRPSSGIKNVPAPLIMNPISYYKGQEKYNWRVQTLNATDCIEKLQLSASSEVFESNIPKDIAIQAVGTTNIKGHIFYTVKITDKKGQREISRRYTEYTLWRSKITDFWPCLILTALPNKTLMGVSEDQIIRTRLKYIIRFIRSICVHQALYESQEVQSFLAEGDDRNWEQYFSQFVPPKYPQLLEKYKKHYTDQYVYSQRQEFMYRKDQMPIVLNEYQEYFSTKKIDLMDYCSAIRRMADSKQTYFKALTRLNQTLLPDYQDNLYRWIYGETISEQPVSIMERMSMRGRKGSAGSNKQQQQKEPVHEKFGLYSSQAFKCKLQDASAQIGNQNSSTWTIYDILRFELKEIDSVIFAIEQSKALQREIEYRKRTITINKEQIEALNNNQTTLKTFFMEGSIDDKKTKLTNDNHTLEEQLQKLTELYYLIMVLLQKQLEGYHKTRSQFYKKSMKKAFNDELGLVRSMMGLSIYEEQLFAKERKQRVQVLRGEDLAKEGKEEIKQ